MTAAAGAAGFAVEGWVDRLGGLVERRRDLWIRLGEMESAWLGAHLDGVALDRPVFICGLPRSGTTILLEAVARHPRVATHRYRDYPFVFTPYWWDRLLRVMETRESRPAERAHRDGLRVTPASPEAMEEPLWMAFFPRLHREGVSALLGRGDSHPAFESFYRDHVRKLLLARGRSRYAAKGNYNLARLGYLQRLFPDARFIVPVRGPRAQVASLMKQQRLFTEQLTGNPAARAHLGRVGHFEFGPDRRVLMLADPAPAREIARAWRHGEELRGWARYWAYVYGDLAARLEADSRLAEAVLVVRFEDLCDRPADTLARLFAHAALEGAGDIVAGFARTVRAPDYYRTEFSVSERRIIAEETAPVAARFGYAP